MRFQLIIQVPGGASADLDALVTLEDELRGRLGSSADVDGHDIGAGEGNIFILTDSPEATFAQIQPLLVQKGLLRVARIAYRNLKGGEFTVLWPASLSGRFLVA